MEVAPEEPAALAEPPMPAEAPAMEESEAIEEPVVPAITEGAAITEDSARIEPTLQQNGMEKSAPGETFAQEVPIEAAPQVQPAPPIGVTLQIMLAVIAILSAIIALTLRYTTIRKWRAKAK